MILTATKHYEALCDMPSCICVDCEVYLFINRTLDLLTTDGKPYIIGTVISITEVPSGGLDVVISYDDSTLPENPATGETLVVTFPTGAQDGTVCDPACKTGCDWVTLMLSIVGNAVGVINKEYLIYAFNQHVVDGASYLPRICFPNGFLLTDVRISCTTYDINTTADFTLKIGSTTIASYSGNLSAQKQFTLLQPLMGYDELPDFRIDNLTNGVYGDFAEGLVLELIGVIAP